MSFAVPMKNTSDSMLGEPGEQRAEQSRGNAAVALAVDAGEALLDLVAEQDARGHGVGDAQSLADVLLGLAH